ncbi:hypothetical protein EOE67_12030 [Rheinheimera riviphila]|uniref:Uncharacterized protein n=1 Tax=Rheinheimera riviphila TaxID=1834037 RepID=A0A437QRA4_9GAMM|nr:hypothetical protein [Rheinheimera riviphila]RVU37032.1 hypothetical protein EOE67_12030 [Rheinheimera riviphila]
MAVKPMVLHLPGESHHMLVSMTQPHSHATKQHDAHQSGHQHGHNNGHDNHNDFYNEDFDHNDHRLAPEITPLVAATSAESHDESSHEQAKHLQGQADVPSQQQLFPAMSAGNESYRYQNQLIGITHSPPVPPPNA